MPFVNLNGTLVTVQPGGDSAEDHRKQTMEFSHAPGPINWSSFNTTIVSGLTLNFTQGAAFVRSPNDFTLYRVSQDGVDAQLTLTPANGSNPRIDQVIIRVYDDAVDSSGQYQATIETIDGTPTSGATLDNRTGAPDPRTALVNANAYLPLADVLVPAGSSTIGGVRMRRPMGQLGQIPPLALTGTSYNVDIVQMIPSPGINVSNRQYLGSDVNAGKQAAALMYLSRAGAYTKVRWSYYVDVLASGSKNFKIALFDASGRYITDSGNIAWTGTSGNVTRVIQALTLPYSGYIFDVGQYYVVMCHGTALAASDSLYGLSAYAGNPGGGTINVSPASANQYLGSQTGGLTLPSALQGSASGFVDLGTGGVSSSQTGVPVIALSM